MTIEPKVGERLDQQVANHLETSRSQAQKHIKEGHVTVNNKPGKASHIIQEHDHIVINPIPHTPSRIQANPMPLRLLYEDADIIVLNKPSGLTVHPVNTSQTNTLANGLLHYCPTLSTISGPYRPGIVHRLDKDTEGIMIIAKHNDCHEHLKNQFKNRSVKKHYMAMVKGDVSDDEGQIEAPIGRHPSIRRIRAVVPDSAQDAKAATTHFKVLKRYGSKTLVDIQPLTGRTHQIRVHFQHIGHPLLGDPDYGPDRKKGKGQLLQAYSLGFTHPRTRQWMTFTVSLSDRLGV